GPLCAGFQPLRTGAAQRAAEAGGGVETEAGGGLTQGVATAPAPLCVARRSEAHPGGRMAAPRSETQAGSRSPTPAPRPGPRPGDAGVRRLARHGAQAMPPYLQRPRGPGCASLIRATQEPHAQGGEALATVRRTNG